jgi:hypothetical protein
MEYNAYGVKGYEDRTLSSGTLYTQDVGGSNPSSPSSTYSSRVDAPNHPFRHDEKVRTMIKPNTAEFEPGTLPPSCLGPDGRFREETEEERKKHLESARWRLREIAEIPNGPDDLPD